MPSGEPSEQEPTAFPETNSTAGDAVFFSGVTTRAALPHSVAIPLDNKSALVSDAAAHPECPAELGLDGRRNLGNHVSLGSCTPRPGKESTDSVVRHVRHNDTLWSLEDMIEFERVSVDFSRVSIHTVDQYRGLPKYAPAAVSVTCAADADLTSLLNTPETFSTDNHVQSMIGTGLAVDAEGESPCAGADVHVSRPTILLTREGTTGSQWHNMMEVVGLYVGLVSSTLTGDSDDVQIVIMDGHHYVPNGQGEGNLVPLVQLLSAFPVVDSRVFEGKKVCFDKLVYAVPGWRTYPWSNVWKEEPCLAPAPLYMSFKARVLHGLGEVPSLEQETVAAEAGCALTPAQRAREGPLRLLFLHRTGTRSLENEVEAVEALQAIPGIEVSVVTFGFEQTFAEQVHALREADIVVSVHGAGLVNTLFAKPLTGVVELLPRAYEKAHYFNNTAAFMCNIYRGIQAHHPHDPNKCIVDLKELVQVVGDLVKDLVAERAKEAV